MMQKKSPLFSVIVPIYNVESYLCNCLDSIINQTYKDLEIILIDDGSPDNCGKICDEYAEKDKRVKVVHKLNGGLVSARQSGASIATGTYIACIDGDDWIAPEYFQFFAERIDENPCDILCCGMIWWKTDNNCVTKDYGVETGLYNRKKIEDFIFPMLIESKNCRDFNHTLCSKIIARELYCMQQLSVDASIKIGEDAACLKPCIYHANSLYVTNKCMYYYRQNDSSMTKKTSPFDWNMPKLIGHHFEKQIPMTERDFQAQVYRNVVHNLFNVAFTQFYQEKKYRAICLEINEHLSDDYYKRALAECRFNALSKGNFAKIALKHRLYFLLWLYKKRHEKKGF